ncbi:fatty acid desaturase [Rouxiella sp. Mn2063]|uniref:fatty acid desaturase n=1 Tax=Rouxiella sp. Mn2063 TaxID=3395262 RepID=UPI003BBA47C3
MHDSATSSDDAIKDGPFYLHAGQRADIKRRSQVWWWRLEIPTWILGFVVYSGWFLLVIHWQQLNHWLAAPLLVIFTTWYLSWQHELIHGHPTRWERVNQLLGTLPIAVWYPYGLYRDSHLQHHRNERLTHPEEDPESYYFSEAHWQHSSAWFIRLIKIRNTFFGRLLIAPALDIIATVKGALQAVVKRDYPAIAMWGIHLVLLVALLAWVQQHGISAVYYLLVISYPALSLTKVRSFYEHRAAEAPEARSTLTEAGIGWRLLFLNLNYHLVHHDLPGLPWYGLPQVYQADKEAYQQRSQGYVVEGYQTLMQQYAATPLDVEIHPFYPERPGGDTVTVQLEPSSITSDVGHDYAYQNESS